MLKGVNIVRLGYKNITDVNSLSNIYSLILP